MSTWDDLTAFQRDILREIRALEREDNESYGLAIKSGLETRYGKEVNHGRLYPNLNSLVDKGLVSKSELDKRTNEYTLTGIGSRELTAAIQSDAELLDTLTETAPQNARADGSGNEGGA